MSGRVEEAAQEALVAAQQKIASAAANVELHKTRTHFRGNSVVGYEVKMETLTEGEQEALSLLRKKKSIKTKIDKDNPQALKAGGLLATVEWVAAKCKELGC